MIYRKYLNIEFNSINKTNIMIILKIINEYLFNKKKIC